MFVHRRTQYLRQRFDLQVTYALWQPGLALTGVATATLVNQYGVVWPRTSVEYPEVLGCVYLVVLKEAFIDHCQYLQHSHRVQKLYQTLHIKVAF